jgi:dTDP-4-dehydrorhamnose reductase
MQRIKVLVTGSSGQLGSEIQLLEQNFTAFDFIFTNSKNLDISNRNMVSSFFKRYNFDYCINSAAYTNVDNAELQKEKALAVNVEGVENLVINCAIHNTIFIHISTDYVFSGDSITPYTESDKTDAINYYGQTKLEGEQIIQKLITNFFIIRSSWLYGREGNNFVKTISKLSKTKKTLIVVDDQIGSPTNAKDLASFIMYLISTNNKKYGIINFSNQGAVSWYDFAKKILEFNKSKTVVSRTTSELYPTKALRPKYSVLSLEKVKNDYNYKIRDWKVALKEYIDNRYNK